MKYSFLMLCLILFGLLTVGAQETTPEPTESRITL
jgi:hypothetical protein